MIPSLWECFGVWFHARLSKLLSLLIIPCEVINWCRLEEGFKAHSPYTWFRTSSFFFYHSLMFSAIIRCGEMFTPFSKHNYGNYKPVFPHLGSHEMSSKCGCFLVLIASKYNRCFSVSFCPCLLLFSEVKEKVLSKYSELYASSIDGCCNNVSGNSNNYNIHTIMCQFYSAE